MLGSLSPLLLLATHYNHPLGFLEEKIIPELSNLADKGFNATTILHDYLFANAKPGRLVNLVLDYNLGFSGKELTPIPYLISMINSRKGFRVVQDEESLIQAVQEGLIPVRLFTVGSGTFSCPELINNKDNQFPLAECTFGTRHELAFKKCKMPGYIKMEWEALFQKGMQSFPYPSPKLKPKKPTLDHSRGHSAPSTTCNTPVQGTSAAISAATYAMNSSPTLPPLKSERAVSLDSVPKTTPKRVIRKIRTSSTGTLPSTALAGTATNSPAAAASSPTTSRSSPTNLATPPSVAQRSAPSSPIPDNLQGLLDRLSLVGQSGAPVSIDMLQKMRDTIDTMMLSKMAADTATSSAAAAASSSNASSSSAAPVVKPPLVKPSPKRHENFPVRPIQTITAANPGQASPLSSPTETSTSTVATGFKSILSMAPLTIYPPTHPLRSRSLTLSSSSTPSTPLFPIDEDVLFPADHVHISLPVSQDQSRLTSESEEARLLRSSVSSSPFDSESTSISEDSGLSASPCSLQAQSRGSFGTVPTPPNQITPEFSAPAPATEYSLGEAHHRALSEPSSRNLHSTLTANTQSSFLTISVGLSSSSTSHVTSPKQTQVAIAPTAPLSQGELLIPPGLLNDVERLALNSSQPRVPPSSLNESFDQDEEPSGSLASGSSNSSSNPLARSYFSPPSFFGGRRPQAERRRSHSIDYSELPSVLTSDWTSLTKK